MAQHGMSQKMMAMLLEWNQSCLCNWLYGRRHRNQTINLMKDAQVRQLLQQINTGEVSLPQPPPQPPPQPSVVEWRLRVDAARMGANMHASSLRRTGTSSDGWLSRNTLSRKYGNSGKGWPTDRDGLKRTESSIWDGRMSRMNQDERRMNQ